MRLTEGFGLALQGPRFWCAEKKWSYSRVMDPIGRSNILRCSSCCRKEQGRFLYQTFTGTSKRC